MEKMTLHTIAVLISHIYDHPLSDPICCHQVVECSDGPRLLPRLLLSLALPGLAKLDRSTTEFHKPVLFIRVHDSYCLVRQNVTGQLHMTNCSAI